MLRFFFYNGSWFVKALEAVLALRLAWLWHTARYSWDIGTLILAGALTITYLSMRICAWLPLYSQPTGVAIHRKHYGIKKHFSRIMTGTTYILLLGVLLLHAPSPWSWLVILPALSLGAFLHINTALLWMHFDDPAEHPVNYYSAILPAEHAARHRKTS